MIVLKHDSSYDGKFRLGPRVLRAPNTRLLRWVGKLWDSAASVGVGALVFGFFVPFLSFIGLAGAGYFLDGGDDQVVSTLEWLFGYPLAALTLSLIFTSWVLFPLSVIWLFKSSDRHGDSEDGRVARLHLSNLYDTWAALPTRNLRRSTRPLLEQARVAAQAYVLDSSRSNREALESRERTLRNLLTQSRKVQVKLLPLNDDEDVQAVVGLTNALRELDELPTPVPKLIPEQVEQAENGQRSNPGLPNRLVRRRG